jgi:putative peptidoglycan lipid II flippase
MFGIGVSRVFGLVREQVVAFYFGRSAAYSAFIAAYKVPNLVRVLLGEGNLSASFIPVLAEAMRSGDPARTGRLARGVLGLLLAVVAVLTLAGMAAAPALAWIVAPGFDPALRELVERLIVILFPTMAFMVVGAWCMGVLHAHGRFFWPNLAPLFWSVASAGALIAFVGRVEVDPVYVLAWGVVAGSVLQLAVQLPAVKATLATLAPAGGWRDPAVRKVVALFGPMLVGTGVAQLSTLIDVQIASFISDQSVATLAYAQRLYLLPLSLFGVAIAQVALPTLSHDVVAASGDRIRIELGTAWRRMAFLMVPSALALAAFGRPAVSLLFERGRFDAGDSSAVTWVLAAYAVGLLAYGAVRLFATAFYAAQDTRTPVRVAVGALVVNAALGVALALVLGTPGIALATALAAIANAAALGAILRRRLGRLPGSIGTDTMRMAAGALLAGALAAPAYLWMLARWPGWELPERLLGAVGFYGGIGGAYLIAARALGVDELRRVRERFGRRGSGEA